MDELKPRDIARLALQYDWRLAAATIPPDNIAQAIDELTAGTVALKTIDPALKGEEAIRVADALRPFGAKIAPTIRASEARAWRMALVIALSDLPPLIALRAAKRAIHVPMQFLNEVEGHIRAAATEMVEQQRVALVRLRRLHEELDRALNAPPALPAPEPEPVTEEEVQQLNAFLRGCGVSTRYRLDGDQAVAVEAEA
jgi:hypothetical protein